MDAAPPLLLQYIFGEAARAAHSAASPRLLHWCRAFDGWLAERQQNHSPTDWRAARASWKQLLAQQPKMLWELTPADFEQHQQWMRSCGFAVNTIAAHFNRLVDFYRWTLQHHPDPLCPPGFNPALAVRPPRHPSPSTLISRQQLAALLDCMRRDCSASGSRLYALTMLRLSLGATLSKLARLRWGQIELDPPQAGESAPQVWVRLAEGGLRHALPPDTWQAVQSWLSLAGLQPGMEAEDCLFPALAPHPDRALGKRTIVQDRRRPVGFEQLRLELKRFSSRAGIAADALTMTGLRQAAIRLQLDQGASVEQMRVFMDSRSGGELVRRLRKFPQFPQAPAPEQAEVESQPPVVDQPSQAVLRVMKENISGLAEEIVGLRRLARGLHNFKLPEEQKGSQATAQLSAAYTQASSRLATVIKANMSRQAERQQDDQWCDQVLDAADQDAALDGKPPVSDAMRRAALDYGGEGSLSTARLGEEIATTRLILRGTLQKALQAEQQGDWRAYAGLVDSYGSDCVRLVRLLRGGDDDGQLLKAYLLNAIQASINEASKDWPDPDAGDDHPDQGDDLTPADGYTPL